MNIVIKQFDGHYWLMENDKVLMCTLYRQNVIGKRDVLTKNRFWDGKLSFEVKQIREIMLADNGPTKAQKVWESFFTAYYRYYNDGDKMYQRVAAACRYVDIAEPGYFPCDYELEGISNALFDKVCEELGLKYRVNIV